MTIYRDGDWRLGLVRFAKGMGAIALMESCAIAFPQNWTWAQNITLDGTLGQPGTLTGPAYIIPQALGQTVGNNLFHSFGKFNLNTGEEAYFQSAANIRNILSRVTGGSPSSINGLILTDSANVNLFLINPSGIQFGPNARLDVGGTTRGSFVATTVDALVWSNGSQFSATNPGGANSLLTMVGDPSGFLASQRTPQPIALSRSILKVYEGQSLLLLGGDVTLDQSILYVDYFKGGRIELGGVAGAGTVGLSVNGNDLVLGFPNDVTRADVSLANGSLMDVSAEDGGNIAIHARNLNISGGSALRGGIGSGLGFPGSQAGDIIFNATGTVRVDNSSVESDSDGVEG
ncbi:MAG TPA: filamentous hemagglutinin N-terminal domain-containing protein, partial [Allocoleopsis sp.]